MDATKPYEFIGFGAMDATKPYEFIGFGAMDATTLFPVSRPLPYDNDRSTLNGPAAVSATLPRRRQQTSQP